MNKKRTSRLRPPYSFFYTGSWDTLAIGYYDLSYPIAQHPEGYLYDLECILHRASGLVYNPSRLPR